MLLTPKALQERATLYHELGQMFGAGVDLVESLTTCRMHAANRATERAMDTVLREIDRGASLATAFRRTGDWLPSLDAALLDASERSGRLETGFKELSDYYRDRGELMSTACSGLAYPVLMLHLGGFLIPLAGLFLTGRLFQAFLQMLIILGPFYGLFFAAVWSLQKADRERWRFALEAAGRRIPALGQALHEAAIARLALALEALIGAGLSHLEAWKLAAAASGSPALKRAVAGWLPRVEAGVTPARAIRQCPEIPKTFADLYETGELTGKLEETLKRLHRMHQELAKMGMKMVAELAPRLVYMFIMGSIAVQILSVYQAHNQQVHAVIDTAK